MQQAIRSLIVSSGRIDRRAVQLVLVILSISLFALGAGAPTGGGGSIPGG